VRAIGFCAANINSNFKGLGHLLEALREIHEETAIRFRLELIGRGEINVENFEFLINRSECRTDVELYQKFSELDLLVVPSLGDNAPSVITEAQIVGTRVIGSTVGGIPEMLGFNQFKLFNVEDRKSIKQCIISNINEDDPTPETDEVKFRHSYSEVAAAYSRLYSSLI
jgi:glycosyltransferase involved in cell wall biosynthesis